MKKEVKTFYTKLNKSRVLSITIGSLFLNAIFPALTGMDNKFTRNVPAYAISESTQRVAKSKQTSNDILGDSRIGNWTVRIATIDGKNTLERNKSNDNFYELWTTTDNKPNKDTGYKVKKSNNSIEIMRTDFKNSSDDINYSVRISSQKLKNFNKGEKYKFNFELKHLKGQSGINIRFPKKINDVSSSHEIKFNLNNKKWSDYPSISESNMWKKLSSGKYTIEKYVYDEDQGAYLQFRINMNRGDLGSHVRISNITAENITEASNPKINNITEKNTVLNGKANLSKNDKRKNAKGDIVEIYKVDLNGNKSKLGTTTVDSNNNWSFNIDKAKYGEKYIAKIYHPRSGKTSIEDIKNVEYNPENHNIKLEEIYEGDELIIGEGYPGDDIILQDLDGNEIGRGLVNENGTFEIKTSRPLEKGEEIIAKPITVNKEGQEDIKKVKEKPSIEDPVDGDKTVVGKGEPGEDLVVKDEEGDKIGEGTVDEDGNFEIELDRPLEDGEEITVGKEDSEGEKVTVKPKEDSSDEGKNPSGEDGEDKDDETSAGQDNPSGEDGDDKDDETNAGQDKPSGEDGEDKDDETNAGQENPSGEIEVNDPVDGDETVEGKGEPGDNLVVKDEEGNKLGEGTVDEDGEFEIELDRPLEEGEEITVGREDSEGEKVTVQPKDDSSDDGKETEGGENPSGEDEEDKDDEASAGQDKPSGEIEVNDPVDGDETVEGKGEPGDNLVVKDEEGNKLGEGTVDEDGKFEIELDRPLEEGEEITVGREDSEGEKLTVQSKDDSSDEGKDPSGEDGDDKDDETSAGQDNPSGEDGEDKDDETNAGQDKPSGEDGEDKDDETNAGQENPSGEIEVNDPVDGDETVEGKGEPGDNLVVKDEEGNKLGEGTVDEDGEFEIELDRPLEEGEEITVGREDSEGEKVTVKPKDDSSDDGKDTEGGENPSGEDEEDKDDETSAGQDNPSGEDGDDKDDETNAGQDKPSGEDGEDKDDETNAGQENPSGEIEVNDPVDGDETVEGKGEPGDNLVVKDEEGNKLGEGTVDEDGEFEIELDRPLEEGEEITVGREDSEGEKVTVQPKDDSSDDGKETEGGENPSGEDEEDKDDEASAGQDKPSGEIEVNDPVDGDETVEGKGEPGDNLVVKDEEGNKLGEGTVDEDGKFEIELDRPLEEGEEITVGREDSEGEKVTVQPKDDSSDDGKDPSGEDGDDKDDETNAGQENPSGEIEVNDPVDGDETVEGKGEPGDNLVVKDEEGNKLGEGTVGEDGEFEIELDRPLEEGEEITVGKEDSEGEKVTVKPKEEEKPSIEDPVDGDETVEGKGEPGDNLVVKDEEGNKLGEGTVDEDGEFEIELDRPLEEGEEITVGKEDSEGEKVTVKPKDDSSDDGKDPSGEDGDDKDDETNAGQENPSGEIEVNDPVDGDETVEGKGEPGEDLVVKDEEGNKLGEGTVDEDGEFEIELDRPLEEGEEITVGREDSEGEKLTVQPKEDDEDEKTISSGGGSSSSRRKRKDKNRSEDTEKEVVGNIVDREESIDNYNSKGTIDSKLNSNDHFAYIKGYTDNTVRPEAYISREEVAAVFYRLLDETYRNSIETKSHNFKDLDNNRWSTIHIATLANGKILKGYQDGSFRPKENITRAELTSIISGLSELKLENINRDKAETFIDISGHWAEDYIKSANKKDWVKGYQDKTFRPDRNITRAEFVTIVNNVLNRKVRKEGLLDNRKEFPDLLEDKWYYEDMQEAINSHYYEKQSDGYEKWIELYDFIIEK